MVTWTLVLLAAQAAEPREVRSTTPTPGQLDTRGLGVATDLTKSRMHGVYPDGSIDLEAQVANVVGEFEVVEELNRGDFMIDWRLEPLNLVFNEVSMSVFILETMGGSKGDLQVGEHPGLRVGDKIYLMGEDNRLQIVTVEVLYRRDNQVVVEGALEQGQKLIINDLLPAINGMLLKEASEQSQTVTEGSDS